MSATVNDVTVRAEHLAKAYRITRGLSRQPYHTLQEDVARLPLNVWRRLTGKSRSTEVFWALEDVTFTASRGEVIGVIGRNGAGKSTLLKVLSRITQPTRGRAEIFGRVGALLEIGTGFHPELTGRENVFLSGAILGMRKAEISRRFDDIVSFAEIDQFVDTPAKRYSSGMYTRLAFAVAAHLDPEILFIDEVLAVGDASFQKKCLGKMEDVAGQGRTVFFVSHNTQAVRQLCTRCIVLWGGHVVFDGATDAALSHYHQALREMRVDSETGIHNYATRRGGGAVRFTSVSVEDQKGEERYNFQMGETVRFRLAFHVYREMRGLTLVVALRSGMTREIITSVRHTITEEKVRPGADGAVTIDLPRIYIRPGEYPLYIHIGESVHTRTNFDVLDDLTPPLVIAPGGPRLHANFDPAQPLGVFSLPSEMRVDRLEIPTVGRQLSAANHELPAVR